MRNIGNRAGELRQRTGRRPVLLGVLLGAALLLPAAGWAGQGEDSALASQAKQQLTKKKLDRVDVRVDNGEATLTGTVDNLRQKAIAEKVVGRVVGSDNVDNQAAVYWGGRSADEIAGDVQVALDSPHFNTVFDWVQADVVGRTVVLSGWVTQPWKVEAAERAMSRIPGVDRIEAKIEILPVSIFDDQIRVSAARRLYGDLAFVQYASMLNPPIHIVVRNGELVLLGEVHNRAEKMLARTLVSSSGLPFRIVNQLSAPGSTRS